MAYFDALFADALPALMEGHAEAIVCRTIAGMDVPAQAIVGMEETQQVTGRDGVELRRVRRVTLCRDAAGDFGGVADPETLLRVTVAGVDYGVTGVERADAGVMTLILARPEPVEIGKIPGGKR